jgi:hypothetical protein
MSDATIAALSAVAVAVITAIVGPLTIARAKRKREHDAAPTTIGAPRPPSIASGSGPTGTNQSRPLGPISQEQSLAAVPDSRAWLRERSPTELQSQLAGIPTLKRKTVSNELFAGRWVAWK